MDFTSFLSLSGIFLTPEAQGNAAARTVLANALAGNCENRGDAARLMEAAPQYLGSVPEGIHLFAVADGAVSSLQGFAARFGGQVNFGTGLRSDLAFLLASPEPDTRYFKALGIVSQALRDRDRLEALRLAATPEVMYRLLIRPQAKR